MTREKIEETRKKFWQIIGDEIEGKAIEYGLKELDVFFDIKHIIELLHTKSCSISDIVPPSYLRHKDLEGIEERISEDDLVELGALVFELYVQEQEEKKRIMLQIDFNVEKNDTGEVIGYSLTTHLNTISEIYSIMMPWKIAAGTINIVIKGNKIAFINKENNILNLEYERDAKELADLNALLSSGKKLKTQTDGLKYKGLRIVHQT